MYNEYLTATQSFDRNDTSVQLTAFAIANLIILSPSHQLS
jgi:hypothetical protein